MGLPVFQDSENSQDLVAERREEKSQRMSQAKKEEKNSMRKLAWAWKE